MQRKHPQEFVCRQCGNPAHNRSGIPSPQFCSAKCRDDSRRGVPQPLLKRGREEVISLRAALAEAERRRGAQDETIANAMQLLHEEVDRAERADAALAELRDERQSYISRELYITKARDKAEAGLASANKSIEVFQEGNRQLRADLAAARDVIQFYSDEFYDEGERGRAFLERTAAEPVFRPCVVQYDEIGATEMVLEDTLIIYQPWGPYKGRAVDLGYTEAGKLVGIKIWDRVAERTAAADDPPECD